MDIEFYQDKRDITLRERGLDFARAAEIFAGVTVTIDDCRRDYGESRSITVGLLENRAVAVVWTARGTARHIISMRYANDREKKRYSPHLG